MAARKGACSKDLEGTCRQKEGQLAGMKAQEEMMEQAGMKVADRLTN